MNTLSGGSVDAAGNSSRNIVVSERQCLLQIDYCNEPCKMAQPPNPPQVGAGQAWNAVLQQIQQGLQDHAQDRAHRVMRDDVLEQIKRTKTCNGGLVAEVREWITEVELCISILGYVQGAVLEVAAGTAQGPLRKELERFVGKQVQLQGAGGVGRAGVAWDVVRDHLRAVFLTQNEAEKLRAEVETG